MLGQDIQVKEAEALRATLSMIVKEMPGEISGKNIVCKIDNQVLKAVLEKKGTSQKLGLNNMKTNLLASILWRFPYCFGIGDQKTIRLINSKGVNIFAQDLSKLEEIFRPHSK